MDLGGRASGDKDVESFGRKPAAQRSSEAPLGPNAHDNGGRLYHQQRPSADEVMLNRPLPHLEPWMPSAGRHDEP